VEDFSMAVDMFLEFDASANIKGESLDKQFPNLLQIDSFDFGGELPVSVEQGSGLGAGKVHYEQFNFKMKSSLASASVFKNMYQGYHIPTACLHLRKSGGGQKEYMTFKFKELMISKYSIDGGSEDPVESMAFAYTAMHMIYNLQDQKGNLTDKREAGWDVKANYEWLG
jgi:type VI secretion system secreted protein Hcp